MRVGVLSDANAMRFQPMEFVAHERHLGVPHIEKHKRKFRGRKTGYRNTHRPRAPYMAQYELAQIMSPENPQIHMEAFGKIEVSLIGL